jgi:hypothetical protein
LVHQLMIALAATPAHGRAGTGDMADGCVRAFYRIPAPTDA